MCDSLTVEEAAAWRAENAEKLAKVEAYNHEVLLPLLIEGAERSERFRQEQRNVARRLIVQGG